MQTETTTSQSVITEEMVAQAWETVLNRKSVDRDADFDEWVKGLEAKIREVMGTEA